MRKLLILTLSVLAVAGCHKPNIPSGSKDPGSSTNPSNPSTPSNPDSPSDPGGTTTPYFNIDIPDIISLYSEAVSETRYDTNISDVSVTASESWCTVSSANNMIMISVAYWGHDSDQDEGDSGAPRRCSVTIKAGTSYTKTITVIQESDIAFVSTGLYGEKVKVKCTGETLKLSINSNCISWNARTDADWITLNVLDNATLQITASPRPDDLSSKRTATVVLTSDINYHITESFSIEDIDPEIDSGNYGYDDEHSDWD